MKKKIIGLILGLLISTSLVKNVEAACRVDSDGQCGRGEIQCNSGSTTHCCSQLPGGDSCSQVPGSTQATIPPTIFDNTSDSNTDFSVNEVIDPTCEGGKGINTAIGCLSVLGSQEEFLGDLLRWAIGVGGGIAFLLIVYAGFMIMTSSGNPDRLKAGQELLTSAISGLILLIFSVFILNLIGVKILQIPEFGGPDTLLINQPR